jgi:hypothetical protein
MSLLTTRLRDVNGVVWHIRNGTIESVGNESQGTADGPGGSGGGTAESGGGAAWHTAARGR